jgi:hypothetical protein
VIARTLASDPEPLENPSLHERFPHLAAALDADVMRERLHALLFAESGLVVEICEKPKVEIGEASCWLQYPLVVRTPSGNTRDELVLGAMFADPAAAGAFEAVHLAPLAHRWSPAAVPAPRAAGVLLPLGLACSIFPVSGWHPTLVDAAHPQRVAEALATWMHGDRPVVSELELVGIRRSRGCVLRYRLDQGEPAVIYGKLGYAAAGEALPAVLAALAERASGGAGWAVALPRCLGHSIELETTFVAEMPGWRPDLHIQAERERIVDAGATVAASLHGSGVSVGGAHSLEDELARAARSVHLVQRDATTLGAQLTSVLDAAAAAAGSIPRQQARFAHGSFAPSQLMFDGPRIGVLDFDRVCQAEPAFDLGRFLAPLRVTLARQGKGDGNMLAQRFLDAYHGADGQPTSSMRVGLYEIASLVRTCARSWLQIKTSRCRQAGALVVERAAELGLLT